MGEVPTEFGTVRCENCWRDVPAHNFEVHRLFCSRNIFRCEQCGEPVLLSEREHHFDLYHALNQCECGIRIPQSELDAHKAELCPCRLVACEHCDARIEARLLKEHEESCPDRFGVCTYCNQKFVKAIVGLHESTDCALRPMQCEYCEMSFPCAEFDAHKATCGSRTERCENCLKFIKLSDLQLHRETDCQYPFPSDSGRTWDGSGGSSPSPEAHEGSFQCPFCSFRGLDEESVTLHVTLECANSPMH